MKIPEILIADINGNYISNISKAWCHEHWPFGEDDVPLPEEIKQENHLNDIPFKFIDKPVGILIGMSEYELLIPQESVYSLPRKSFAVRYKLGWSIAGILQESNAGEKEIKRVKKCNFIRTKDRLHALNPFRKKKGSKNALNLL